MQRMAVAVATLASTAAVAWAAPAKATAEAGMPSYFLPNLVAGIMCVVTLAIACKRFQRD